jgi:hypothetical protein
MLAADYIFWPAVALMAASNFYFSPRIGSGRMVMQWDFKGRPSWSAPKAVGLWGTVIFALAVRLLIWAMMTSAPDMVHGEEFGLLLFSLIVAASHVLMARAAMRAG